MTAYSAGITSCIQVKGPQNKRDWLWQVRDLIKLDAILIPAESEGAMVTLGPIVATPVSRGTLIN